MHYTIRNLVLQTLTAKLELSRIVAVGAMQKLDSPSSTRLEKRSLFRLWDCATRDGETLLFMLEILRQHDRAQNTAA